MPLMVCGSLFSCYSLLPPNSPKALFMLRLNIKAVCKLRGISKPQAWLVKSGFPKSTAANMGREEYENLPLVHLEKMCLLLNCTPNDLLRWEPEAGMDTKGPALAALLPASKDEELGWVAEAGSKTVEELRAIGRKLSRMEDEEEGEEKGG